MRQRLALVIVAIVLIVAGFVATSALFIVDQTEEALVLEFGAPERVIAEPGLWLKRPLVENVIFFDKRLLEFDPPPEEVIAADQKRLVVDSYARYRITNPLLFYQSVGTEASARIRLAAIVSGSLRRVLGSVTLAAVLSPERSAIMRQIRDEVAAEAKSFGIAVVDVRLRRADLPEQNSQAIYARMQSERERQAAQFRAQGAEEAARIRAVADRERTVMLAEARRDGQRLRGLGDAQSIGIYAKAFNTDKPFFAFYRSMQAYRDAFADSGTSFVLSPTGDFFHFFDGGQSLAGNAPGAASAGAPPFNTPSTSNPPASPKPAPPAGAAAAPPAK